MTQEGGTFLKLWRDLEDLAHQTALPNWDYERGRPITPQTWERVRDFLQSIEDAFPSGTNRVPRLSACGDGYVHLVWCRENGDRGVLEVGSYSSFWSILSTSDTSTNSEVAISLLRDALP